MKYKRRLVFLSLSIIFLSAVSLYADGIQIQIVPQGETKILTDDQARQLVFLELKLPPINRLGDIPYRWREYTGKHLPLLSIDIKRMSGSAPIPTLYKDITDHRGNSYATFVVPPGSGLTYKTFLNGDNNENTFSDTIQDSDERTHRFLLPPGRYSFTLQLHSSRGDIKGAFDMYNSVYSFNPGDEADININWRVEGDAELKQYR